MQNQSLKTSLIKTLTENAVILKEQRNIVLSAGLPFNCGWQNQERQVLLLQKSFVRAGLPLWDVSPQLQKANGKRGGLMVSALDSGFERWPGSLCSVVGQDTLLSQYLSTPRSKRDAGGYLRWTSIPSCKG